jgi:hypothetical protein
VAHLLPTASHLLLQALFTESLHGEQLLAPPPFSSALKAPCLLCCMPFPVPYLLFSFFWGGGGGQSVQGSLLVYTKGGCESTMCCLFAHLLVCISQAGLGPASGGMGALLICQCKMVWKAFVPAGSSGSQSFSSWCFFLPSVAPVSQQDF